MILLKVLMAVKVVKEEMLVLVMVGDSLLVLPKLQVFLVDLHLDLLAVLGFHQLKNYQRSHPYLILNFQNSQKASKDFSVLQMIL